MSRTPRTVFLLLNKLIAFSLACIGFATACSDSGKEYGTPNVEYGVPNARFIVSGKVVQSSQKQIINNIRLTSMGDTTYSAADGSYTLEIQNSPIELLMPIRAEDVDGLANGEFAKADTVANFVKPKFTGGDGKWYAGEAKMDVNIDLKAKTK